MAVVLILGSHVAGSRVGGTLVNLVLALSPFEIEPLHVPTTLLGRHPGWGLPGGGAVADDVFAGMLEGMAANGLFASVDVVMTNYFASAAQIRIAAKAITAVKAANPKAIIVIDPVMGDAPNGLYVNEAVACALMSDLIPHEHFLTPNLWELGHITGLLTDTLPQIHYATRTLGCPTVVTSVRARAGIGALMVDGNDAWLGVHDENEDMPKGTGDLLAALFVGHILDGQMPRFAMAKALAGVCAIVDASVAWGTSDLPIIATARMAWTCEDLPIYQLNG